jgi:putative phosphotransacetylase
MPVSEELDKRIRAATLLSVYRQTGHRYVPVAVSNRHVHLSREDADLLFDPGCELIPEKDLVQPGQYATALRVSLVGPKGRIDGIRVLGPIRSATQMEITVTDAYRVGIDAVLRMSGDIASSSSARMESDSGSVEIAEGVIVAARHLHMSDRQADAYRLNDGDVVRLRYAGPREVIFGNFVVRSGADHELEAHIDTDEANAALIGNDALLEIV